MLAESIVLDIVIEISLEPDIEEGRALVVKMVNSCLVLFNFVLALISDREQESRVVFNFASVVVPRDRSVSSKDSVILSPHHEYGRPVVVRSLMEVIRLEAISGSAIQQLEFLGVRDNFIEHLAHQESFLFFVPKRADSVVCQQLKLSKRDKGA